MKLRELGPWLAAPLALIATYLPRANNINGVTDATPRTVQSEPATARAQGSSSARPRVAAATTATPERIDRYCADARHLLWKFANADEPPERNADEIRLSVEGSGKMGRVALDEEIRASQKAKCTESPADEKLKAKLSKTESRFLIVTLPDPILSHLPHEFDRGLEEVAAAAAEARYSMDRFDMPWSPTELEAPGTQEAADKRDPETQPGLILFKHNCDPAQECGVVQLLLVFVVGETPTSGVHKVALSSALDQVEELSSLIPTPTDQTCAPNQPECIKVGLLAPYFTGSVVSLRIAFKAYFDRHPESKIRSERPPLHFSMISGSADEVNQIDLDTAPFETDAFDATSFKATVGYRVEIRDKFLRFLQKELRAQPNEVAILRESNTSYGQNFAAGTAGDFGEFLRSETSDESRDLIARIGEWRRDTIQKVLANSGNKRRYFVSLLEKFVYGDLDALGMNQDPTFVKLRDEYSRAHAYIDLPFPLHVAEIRGTGEAQTGPPEVMTLIGKNEAFFPVLQPKTPGRDLIPAFSELDKADAELAMSRLLSTLSEEKVHYVGIAATDIRDTIYLAREVHSHCPDATVFCFSGSLLFLNPDVANDLRGMLVVSTYPLFARNQLWSRPWNEDARRQFPSEAAEGIFNATLALLNQSDKILEYSPPFVPADGDEEQSVPPVWITAVGKGEMVPIATLPSTNLSNKYFYPLPTPTAVPTSATSGGPRPSP